MSPRSRTTLPLVQPVIPVLRGAPFDDPAWLFEPKYDGFRGLLYVSPRNCWFRSKRGNTMTRFQEFAEQVRDELGVRSAILDGEIVSHDEEGRHIFRRMLAGRGHFHYAAFDLLGLNGRDLASTRPAEAAPRALDCQYHPGAISGALGRGSGPRPAGRRSATRLGGNRGQAEGRPLRPGHHHLVQDQEPSVYSGRRSVGAIPEWLNPAPGRVDSGGTPSYIVAIPRQGHTRRKPGRKATGPRLLRDGCPTPRRTPRPPSCPRSPFGRLSPSWGLEALCFSVSAC